MTPPHPERRTHERLDPEWCGRPLQWGEGRGRAVLDTTEAMAADAAGLVHGGFVFGLADHAAMLAVNHPFVVLAAADVRFLAPVRVGECVEATACVRERSGRSHLLDVEARVGERLVLQGTMRAVVLDRHVLDRSGA